jgi:hypothetical protein
MDLISGHLRRFPNARPETIQHLVRKQEMLQRLRSELKPPKRRFVSAAAHVFKGVAEFITSMIARP